MSIVCDCGVCIASLRSSLPLPQVRNVGRWGHGRLDGKRGREGGTKWSVQKEGRRSECVTD